MSDKLSTHRVPATITPTSINVYHNGRMYAVPSTHINFLAIKDLLGKIEEMNVTPARKFWTLGGILSDKETRIERAIGRLNLLLDVPAYLAVVTEGLVTVTEGGVLYDGEVMHSVLATRIMEHLKSQQDVMPLVKFMNRVKENPKEDIGEELFEWMQNSQLPITEEGHIIAYKRVDPEYQSFHKAPDGTRVDHTPGTVVSMERSEVDHNRKVTCSTGLHFCSYGYIDGYYNSCDGRTIVLEIDPVDVCAIPDEYRHEKGRACRFKVIGEVGTEEAAHFFKDTNIITGGLIGSAAFDPPKTTKVIEVAGAYNDDDDFSHWDEDEPTYNFGEEEDEDVPLDFDVCEECGEDENECWCGNYDEPEAEEPDPDDGPTEAEIDEQMENDAIAEQIARDEARGRGGLQPFPISEKISPDGTIERIYDAADVHAFNMAKIANASGKPVREQAKDLADEFKSVVDATIEELNEEQLVRLNAILREQIDDFKDK